MSLTYIKNKLPQFRHLSMIKPASVIEVEETFPGRNFNLAYNIKVRVHEMVCVSGGRVS